MDGHSFGPAAVESGHGARGLALNLVTSPVLAGFTQAAALLILASQLPTLLGMRSDWGTVWHSPSIYLFTG